MLILTRVQLDITMEFFFLFILFFIYFIFYLFFILLIQVLVIWSLRFVCGCS